MRSHESVLNRRGFLSWTIGGIAAASAGLLAVPVLKYVYSPAMESQANAWTPISSLEEIKPGQPMLFKVSIEKKTGWLKTIREASIYVDTQDGKSFTVLSNTCTHLGCPVRWDSGRQLFLCPCHNGVFDRRGNVVSGPPPRALDRFPTRVEAGKLLLMAG